MMGGDCNRGSWGVSVEGVISFARAKLNILCTSFVQLHMPKRKLMHLDLAPRSNSV